MRINLFILIAVTFFSSCAENKTHNGNNSHMESSTDSLLTEIQKKTFNYFYEGAEPLSGLARERIHIDGDYPLDDQDVVTIGGSGFGLMATVVAIERGFITKEQGKAQLNKVIDFLGAVPRFHGAWAHWYNGDQATVKAFSDKDNGGDIVETAFLAQGLITVREYFKDGDSKQKSIAAKADSLWRGIEWDFYTNNKNVLYWHWSPDHAFGMNHAIQGFDECLIAYLLAASSPLHSIDPKVYHEGWARSGAIKQSISKYDIPTVLKHNAKAGQVGPLFWSHYSFLGLNPKDLTDRYANYWDLVVNHTKINIAYADLNPAHYKGYGADKGWGWTASYSLKGYDAHHPDNDSGVISPTAALSSMPYTPTESIAFANYLMRHLKDKIWGDYGFYDAYSETVDWFPKRYLAIDQGPIVVMIENYRSGLIWDLFMQAPEIQNGLKKLEFKSPYLK
ncbi:MULTISPECIES: glucoamylase family protein [Sphingobacterium]|uniref:glucoamylase family protein n=1 Tax=Sphingobacterium TaxID=28453 RepID=UPI0013D9F1E4|nr:MULTISPECIES: glucoamylase family protein [unclassified Sphingobacterium]